jgi:hypothetical protein
MATPNVQYVLSPAGILDIIPSPGKQVTVNGGTGDGTLSANEVNATNTLKIGPGTTLTTGTLTGTINLGTDKAVINATNNEITGLTSLSVGTVSGIKSLTVSTPVSGDPYSINVGTSGKWQGDTSGNNTLTGVTSITCTRLTDSTATLFQGSLTGLVKVASTLGEIGGVSISNNDITMSGNAAKLTGVSTITTETTLSGATITNGTGQWTSPIGGGSSTLLGMTEVSSSTLSDSVLTIHTGNITNVNNINTTTATIAGVAFASGNITSVNDINATTATIAGVGFANGSITSVSSVAIGDARFKLNTENKPVITDLTSLSVTNIAMSGNLTGANQITANEFIADNQNGTSLFKGNLTVQGDLKVVNNSAKVIELQHEKFSTQDPIIEFNTRLSSTEGDTTTPLNVDFGFINVCESSGTLKSAGLVADVTDSANMTFTFFHSGDYITTTGALNNVLPTTYTRANVRCGRVSTDDAILITGASGTKKNYIAVGSDIETNRSSTDVIFANGNVTSTGTVKAALINVGSSAIEGDEKILCDGLIKTVSLTTQNLTQTSDARKKENVVSIEDSLSSIEKLRPVTFDWKEGGKSDIGFIAQEVREVYPELVGDNGGHLSVAYTGIVAPLVRAVQQQQEMIRALEARLAKLEA